MKLTEIKTNPNNPRLIRDDKFLKLVNSIKEFPKMMELRPIVIDENNVILAGNMRYKALKELKYKDIPTEWIKRADELTEDEKQRFIITDNNSFGEYDWDLIANEWSDLPLEEWGVDLPVDFTDANKEIDTDFDDSKFTFKLEYSESEYLELKDKIADLGQTPEKIFYNALVSV